MKRPLILTTAILMILGTNTSVAQGDADNFYKKQFGKHRESILFQPIQNESRRPALPAQGAGGRAKNTPPSSSGTRWAQSRNRAPVCTPRNWPECGFVTLALDLSFWGESDGEPRNAVLPDVYSEDFSAAVDFLGTRPFVDRERIGVVGDLRQRQLRHQRCKDRPPPESHRNGQHVRHGGSQPQRAETRPVARRAQTDHRPGCRTALCRIPGRGNPFTPAAQYTN